MLANDVQMLNLCLSYFITTVFSEIRHYDLLLVVTPSSELSLQKNLFICFKLDLFDYCCCVQNYENIKSICFGLLGPFKEYVQEGAIRS